MRDKFKVWCKTNKKWNNKECVISESGKLYEVWDNLIIELKKENHVICHATGLKDKNGVEIYEGDVVHYKNSLEQTKGIVKFGGCRFYYKWVDITEPDGAMYFFQCEKELEIIGNVYDDQEWLEC